MRYRDIILARALGKGKRGMAVGWPLMLGVAGGGGTETTVTGVSPLLLAAALKKPLKSLTQYGLCSQADTPTPAASVPIMCNNGALQMVDDELPVGYKRVLGFSMNNNSYWEIEGFPLYGSDTLRFSFEASDACNVIGAYSGSARGNNYSLYVGTNANYLRYIDGAYNSAVDYDTRYDVEITPTGTSGMKTDSTWTAQTFTTPTNLCIGTTATSASSAKLKGKLYGNIEVVGRAKLIPCERVSNNALGYYDTIGEAFYEQASGYDGAVSLGYDGSHYSLAVVGTPETISVGGKNLNGGEIGHKGYSTSTGQESTAAYLAGTRWKIPNVTGKTFTISWGGFPDGTTGVSVTAWKANGAWIATQNIKTTSPYTITYQPSAPTATVNFAVYKTGGITIGDDAWIQVEYGESATAYQPYSGEPETASAPMLLSVGDYADEVEIVSGGVKRNVGIKVFDGTESFSKSGALYIHSVADKATTKSPVLCSHFSYFDGTTSEAADGNLITHTNTNLYFKNSTTATLEAWRAFLAGEYAAGTPVIVIYPLAEETTESVTPQELTTNAGDNTISVTENVSPIELEAVYMKGDAA